MTYYGTADFTPILNRPLNSVQVNNDKTEITFITQDGAEITYQVVGDCCSYSWIEHLIVPEDIAGKSIYEVHEPRYNAFSPVVEENEDYIAVYHTAFKTPVGEIILEYRNSSNGYYGGSLEGPITHRTPDVCKREATNPLDSEDSITILSGANAIDLLNLEGSTIAEARKTFRTLFSIPKDAEAVLNGDVAAPHITLRKGDTLVFSKRVK